MTVASGRMTHRATVENKTSSGTDALGHNVPETYGSPDVVSCFAWSTARKEHIGADKIGTLEDIRMIVPIGTAIVESDRVTQILDRRGRTVYGGPLRVEAVIRRQTHVEVVLDKVQQ